MPTTLGVDERRAAPSAATLSYDPAGRLHQDAAASVVRMLWDGDTLIAEYDNGNALQRRYVFGPGLPAPAEAGEPLVWYEGTGTSDRRWYHADERGSIVAISDRSGAVTNVNTYDEYGIPGSGNVGRFQYTGQQWLSDIGMYYYRARMYSPTFGRFLQTEPIGYGDGMNIYAYAHDDPVNFTDPSGLNSPDCFPDSEVATVCGHPPRPQNPRPFPTTPHSRVVPVPEPDGRILRCIRLGGGRRCYNETSDEQPLPPPLPPRRRFLCVVTTAALAGGAAMTVVDYTITAWVATSALQGARWGALAGPEGLAVGLVIGAIVGYATYRATAPEWRSQGVVARRCRGE